MQLMIASNNTGKVREIREYFSDLPVEVLTIRDIFGDNPPEEPIENSSTFKGNALLKAVYYAERASLPCLADDSGLCVDSLKGFPGVYSHRFAITKNNPNPSDEDRNLLLIKMMREKGLDESFAQYKCAMALVNPLRVHRDGNFFTERVLYGKIKSTPSGTNGFSFDPYFYLKEYDYAKTCADITLQEKNRISHRALAMKDVKDLLRLY